MCQKKKSNSWKFKKIISHQLKVINYQLTVSFTNLIQMFKLIRKPSLDLNFNHLMIWLDFQFSQKEQNLCFLNVLQKIFGINLKIKKISMDSHLEMQYFQDAKMLILELVFMLEAMILIKYLLFCLIKLLRSIMDIK